MKYLKKIILIAAITVPAICLSQPQGEIEFGGGLSGFAVVDDLGNSASTNLLQVHFDYDLLDGPWRAAVGTNFLYATQSGSTIFLPGVKLGRDVINLNINFDNLLTSNSGLVYFGLASRIGWGDEKRNAISISLQGASDGILGYGLSTLGYSYRF